MAKSYKLARVDTIRKAVDAANRRVDEVKGSSHIQTKERTALINDAEYYVTRLTALLNSVVGVKTLVRR